MTPPARLQAAIEILDKYLGGAPVEKALTTWARKSRYAGSKDRAAVRDIVFQCVRCRASYGASGGSETGRGLAIGYAKALSDDADALFIGAGYGPSELSDSEAKTFKNKSISDDIHVKFDAPEWLIPSLSKALGDDLKPVLEKLQSRAPVFVRVNQSKTTMPKAIELMAEDGIKASPTEMSSTALEITENPRKVSNCKALQGGMIDLQDAASQAVCQTIPQGASLRILDYCAGGGGKSLAFADRPHEEIFAHDLNQPRMGDIPMRAARAGVRITRLTTSAMIAKGPYDVVFCDVPCSGSGAWRRSPEAKWAFTKTKLEDLLEIQAEILEKAAKLVTADGVLAYATCSMLCEENEDQIDRFLTANPDWTSSFSKRFTPLDGGDGFFVAHLTQRT
jgi:16S rRNA (cytosine967-C5)-methyltransferase